MNFNDKLKVVLEKPLMVGQYAVQTDHPGLMKHIKKKKVSKVDRSPFTNDEDAKKEYITGTIDGSGKIKKNTKIERLLSRRLESINDR